jgi:hypothetical protein
METNQIDIKTPELLEFLIHKADLHEGEWELAYLVHTGNAATAGPNGESVPSVVTTFHGVALKRVAPELTKNPGAVWRDAAIINPIPKNFA